MGRASGATQTTVNNEVHRGRVENMDGGFDGRKMEGMGMEMGLELCQDLEATTLAPP